MRNTNLGTKVPDPDRLAFTCLFDQAKRSKKLSEIM
jgi:hypothetical protein